VQDLAGLITLHLWTRRDILRWHWDCLSRGGIRVVFGVVIRVVQDGVCVIFEGVVEEDDDVMVVVVVVGVPTVHTRH
jgi:hypothetical protein